MTDEQSLGNTPRQEESINLYAIFFKYFAYWPWFVASVLVCLVGCYIYLRFQTPVYSVSSSVLIKEEDSRNNSSSSPLATMQDLGMFSMTNNFDNEVEILKSPTLVRKVVDDMLLYISISEKRLFGYNTPLYKTSPVNVYMNPGQAEKLEEAVRLDIHYLLDGKMHVKAEYVLGEKKGKLEQHFDALPAVFPTPVGVFNITPNDSILNDTIHPLEKDVHLVATVASPTGVALNYVDNMTVEPTSKTTTIAQVTVQTTVKQRGIDFINSLVDAYNRDTNDGKNEVAQKTADFIEERIGIINQDLGTTESELAEFKQRAGLTDLTSDAQQALQESSRYEQQRMENAIQIGLVTSLKEYINNPQNRDEVLPVDIGYTDNKLTSAIDQYNTMLIERRRLLRTSSENNPTVVNMNTGIEAMRHTVLTTVDGVLRGLQIAQADIERQARKFEGRISDAPLQEKEFIGISRQQEIKAALYTMLLQKREENAITLAATANNARIIKEPLAAKYPVAPRKKLFMLAAFVLGMGIPVGIVYLCDLLKYKIENREDVEKITDVPVVGEIPLCPIPEGQGTVVVREDKNGIMEETFRALRTNLLFMLDSSEKVIMFTSSQRGEGKSFIAGNTAVSLALTGRKVIVVGLDIRKPGLNKVFNLSRREEGITNYLRDPDHVDLFEMIRHSNISPNLDILPGGSIPPNPTELVERKALDVAIGKLKEVYDCIVLDTAPIRMVTDTAIIGRVADLCVYVCRADETPKAAYGYINVLRDSRKYPKLATLINSIDLNKRKNSYGYGYGEKYGYGYGHYGYGYGNEDEEEKKRRKK